MNALSQRSRCIRQIFSSSRVRGVDGGLQCVRFFASKGPQTPVMYCFQCEQTKVYGCNFLGSCGKTPEISGVQDALVHSLKGLAQFVRQLRPVGVVDAEIDSFVLHSLLTTLTNANYCTEEIFDLVHEACRRRDACQELYKQRFPLGKRILNWHVSYFPQKDLNGVLFQAQDLGLFSRGSKMNSDSFGLQECLTYIAKGVAAFAAQARAMNQFDEELMTFIYETLSESALNKTNPMFLLNTAIKSGQVCLRAMENLEAAHLASFGTPMPTDVSLKPYPGPCVLVSGCDLQDLFLVLQQTEGKGINVFTHGEMLSGHSYPVLRQFKHLRGHFGGSWQLQTMEFSLFPGPVIMTTNCLTKPQKSYKNRLYTTNFVRYDDVKHIADKDFSPVIEDALSREGFTEDDVDSAKDTFVRTGHSTAFFTEQMGQIVSLVKSGAISRFIVIGGSDGSDKVGSYYTKLALSAPQDTVILTMGCAKFRFNRHLNRFGVIEGTDFPRLLDLGQCSDTNVAIKFASALSEALCVERQSLPISFVFSWYEQKSLAVIFSLLHAGFTCVRIGPTWPRFFSDNMRDEFGGRFRILYVNMNNVEGDLQRIMEGDPKRKKRPFLGWP